MKKICICGNNNFKLIHSYDRQPRGEIIFKFSSGKKYNRKIYKCNICGHLISMTKLNMNKLYESDYINSTYKDDRGFENNFNRIIRLKPSLSDNEGRVKELLKYAEYHFSNNYFLNKKPSILDVGSGLCVFLYKMKKAGWECTAVDPDKRAIYHAKNNVGIKAIFGDFQKLKRIGKYDVVTFNRVLEHVENPIKMLEKCNKYLKNNGFIYIEVPDGEIAAIEGFQREEFFIEHFHIFSMASLAIMIMKAGFKVQKIVRFREPSKKYTIRAFLNKINS